MDQVSAEFDRNYDPNEYEEKIASIIQKIALGTSSHGEVDTESWDSAVEKLSEGDHYLSVLVSTNAAARPRVGGSSSRDRVQLWTTAFAIVFGLIGLIALCNWILGQRFWAAVNWLFEDRDRLGLVSLIALAIWFLWVTRNNLKAIVKDLLKRS